MPRPRLPHAVRATVRPLEGDERIRMEGEASAHRSDVAARTRADRRLGLVFAGFVVAGIIALWVAVAAGRETAPRAGVVSGLGVALVAAGAWWQRRSERGEAAILERNWAETLEQARVVEIDALVHGVVAMEDLLLCDVGEGWWLLIEDEGGALAEAPAKKLRYRSLPGAPAEISMVGEPVPVRRGTFDWTALPDGHPVAEAEPPVFYRAPSGDPVAAILAFSHGWVVRAEG